MAAGAVVSRERLQGKGHVVRRMFADVDADIYVLVDGDGTYDASAAPAMVAQLEDEMLDMVTGTRLKTEVAAYRRGHRFGNGLLTGIVARLFQADLGDMLSGYRVFSRRFVKIVSGAVRGVRDRDGVHRACAGAGHADRRGGDGLSREAGGIGFEIAHFQGWCPDLAAHPRAREG